MNLYNAQRDVEEFNIAAGRDCPEYPRMPGHDEAKLSMNLVIEECNELLKALNQRKPEQILDAVCDLLYVTLAIPVFMGINIEPFFKEVHRSNMTKFVNNEVVTDRNNKIIKGPKYTQPKLHTLFTKIYHEDLYSI